MKQNIVRNFASLGASLIFTLGQVHAGVVTNPLDDGNLGSLRKIIANAASGETITFAPSLNGKTIALTNGQLVLTKNVQIVGPGANELKISGGGTTRVFYVSNGITATISGLTIADGTGTTQIPTGGGVTGGVVLTNTGTNTLSGATVVTGGSLVINSGTIPIGSATTTVNAVLTTGTGGLVKVGSGTLTLAGANTLTGAATITGGTLVLNPGTVIPSGSATTTLNAVLTTNAGATLTVGSGALTLTGANTYTGSTTVNGGSLTLNSGTTSGTLSATGLPTTGTGTTILTGANTYTGSTTINSGTLTVNGGATTATGTGTLAVVNSTPTTSGGTLTVSRLVPTATQIGEVNFGTSTTLATNGGTLALNGGTAPATSATLLTVGNATTATGTGTSAVGTSTPLTFTSGGTLTVNGGVTTSTGGTLVAAGNVGTSTTLATNGGTLTFSGTDTALGGTLTAIGASAGAGVISLVGTTTTPAGGLNLISGFGTVGIVLGGQFNIGTGGTTNLVGIPLPKGGSIYNDGATLTVSTCTISGNTGGAAIYNAWRGSLVDGVLNISGSLTLISCTVSGNSANPGLVGGIENGSFATATVINSTVTGNNGFLQAGAIFSGSGARLNLRSSTISGNSVPFVASQFGAAGGVTIMPGTITVTTATSQVTFTGSLSTSNTIFSNNTGGNFSGGGVTSDGYNLSDDATMAAFLIRPNDLNNTPAGLDVDAQGQPRLQDNGGPTQTIALLPGSAAIDKGGIDLTPILPPKTDQRGFPRIANGRQDIGAFETQTPKSLSLAVQLALQAIPATNDPTSHALRDVLNRLTSSLLPMFWVDDTHLSMEGHAVFDADHFAVDQLAKIVQAHGPRAADAQDWIDYLVNADEVLAKVAIHDAAAGDPHKLAEANREFTLAEQALDQDKFPEAVDHFSHAWEQARQAIR